MTEHGLTVTVQKTKLMAFKGQDPVTSIIVIDNKTTEQVNSFNYLRNISYEKEEDTDSKLNNYLQITGIINNTFRAQKTLKKTRIKLHNTLALPALYTVVTIGRLQQDTKRITAAEMKYIRNTAGYTWTDYKTNTEIAKELNITPVLDKIQYY